MATANCDTHTLSSKRGGSGETEPGGGRGDGRGALRDAQVHGATLVPDCYCCHC